MQVPHPEQRRPSGDLTLEMGVNRCRDRPRLRPHSERERDQRIGLELLGDLRDGGQPAHLGSQQHDLLFHCRLAAGGVRTGGRLPAQWDLNSNLW